MNFDILMHDDLMTGLHGLSLLLILNFWQYSPHCVVERVKEFKIHLVETVS